MKKTSRLVSHYPGARSFSSFVRWCVDAKGVCNESDCMAYVCDTYKREYVLRYAAADVARCARKGRGNLEENVAVRFLSGRAITEQEAERLYSRGVTRLFNDLRFTCCGRSKSVAFCRITKTFTPIVARDCDASAQ